MKKLYYGGDIVTMEDRNDAPQALVTEAGRISFLGSLEEAKAMMTEEDELVDLGGKTLMPGFIDPHSHFFQTAQGISMCDLSDTESFEDIAACVKNYIKVRKVTEDGIVFGTGYDHNFLREGCHPDRHLLDAAAGNIPVYISHVSGHIGVANSALLELAGLNAQTPDPQGGRFGRDAEGNLTGYVEETPALMQILSKAMLRLRIDIVSNLLEAQELYLKHGITTTQEGAAAAATMKGLTGLADAGMLKLDVVSYVMEEDYDKTLETYADRIDQYRNHVRLGGMKIILDGSPQGKSAWLSAPYEGEESFCGYPTHDDAYVEKAIASALDSNSQLLAHCNGDAASEQFVECFRRVLAARGATSTQTRPVMVHCQTVREDQLDAMKEIGMLPTIFIGHTWYWGDIHLHNLGQERGENISPVRWALDRGMNVTFHQDTPVTRPDMLHSVWCAVNRKTRTGVSIGAHQAVTVWEALQAVTINGAYQYHEEKEKGSLVCGKRADLVILSENPLKKDPADLLEIKVCSVIKDGDCVYQA